jgi:hypothetical protein
VETISPRSHEALPLPAQRPPARRSPEIEVQQALQREMIRVFVDDFRHQVDRGRRQMRYRMVKYLIS